MQSNGFVSQAACWTDDEGVEEVYVGLMSKEMANEEGKVMG